MPRQARSDVPGLVHHVIARGIERRDIFDGDRDRQWNRFKRILVEDELYVLERVRCVALSPARPGLAATPGELDDYRWSGHTVPFGAYVPFRPTSPSNPR